MCSKSSVPLLMIYEWQRFSFSALRFRSRMAYSYFNELPPINDIALLIILCCVRSKLSKVARPRSVRPRMQQERFYSCGIVATIFLVELAKGILVSCLDVYDETAARTMSQKKASAVFNFTAYTLLYFRRRRPGVSSAL